MKPSTLRVLQLRECSKVERVHTLPHHGSYTDGQHSYDAAMLYLALCPEPTFKLTKAILAHDLGERWSGDIPAPAKWASPVLATTLDEIERHCRVHLGFDETLTPEEHNWLKAVDCLELWLWAQEQIALGNRNAEFVINNLSKHFERADIPVEVRDFLDDYYWTRTEDRIPS